MDLRTSLVEAAPFLLYALLYHVRARLDGRPSIDVNFVIDLQSMFMRILGRQTPYLHHLFKSREDFHTDTMAALVSRYDPDVDYAKIDWKPDNWGPRIWRFVHLLSIEAKNNCDASFNTRFAPRFSALLPCPVCADHYDRLWSLHGKEWLLLDPVTMYYRIHNAVTADIYRQRNRIPPPFSPDDFQRLYGERPCP